MAASRVNQSRHIHNHQSNQIFDTLSRSQISIHHCNRCTPGNATLNTARAQRLHPAQASTNRKPQCTVSQNLNLSNQDHTMHSQSELLAFNYHSFFANSRISPIRGFFIPRVTYPCSLEWYCLSLPFCHNHHCPSSEEVACFYYHFFFAKSRISPIRGFFSPLLLHHHVLTSLHGIAFSCLLLQRTKKCKVQDFPDSGKLFSARHLEPWLTLACDCIPHQNHKVRFFPDSGICQPFSYHGG